MKKKTIICIISVVLVIGIILIINMNKNNKKYDYDVEKLGDANYFLLMQGNKYGIIDKKGNILIDPVYDIIEIPNPTKDIFICKNNYNVDTKEYNVQVFNKNKEPILYQYYIVEAIPLNNVEQNGNYEKSILRYKSEGLYGITDINGNKITDPIFETIDGFEYNEGLLLVKKSGKYGIINMNGAVIIKNKYDEILSDAYYEDGAGYKYSGYIVGTRTDDGMRYGYIDYNRKQLLKNEYNDIYRIEKKNDKTIYTVAYKNGKAGVYSNKKNIIKHEYEDITYNTENDLFIVQKASKQGVAKFDGTIIIPIDYENIFFAGKFINAQKGDSVDIFDSNGNKEHNSEYISKQNYNNDRYEVVSTSGDEYRIIIKDTGKIIANNYSYIQYLYNNYFISKKDNLFGIIDDNGNNVIDHKYNVIQPVYEFDVIQLIDEKNNVLLINKNFEKITTVSNSNIYTIKDYLKICTETGVRYIDKRGNIVENTKVYENNKLFAFSKKGKWGFKDKTGNTVIDAIYDDVTEFNEYGYAGIKNKDLWGVIDENGNVIIDPTYKLDQDPSFINEYYKVDLGYGEPFYTK